MDTPEIRLQLALRLKAARYLAGGLRATKKGGGSGQEAAALSVEELVKREPLRVNGIAVDRIQGYEQMRLAPRPMELERIAEGLGVPAAFLLGEAAKQEDRLARILEIVQEMQSETRRRYEALESRLGKVDPEVADEAIRILAEARMRGGRDIGRRYRSDALATDRLSESSTDG